MKYLFPTLIISLCLVGFGCLEAALEYPKEFKTNETLTETQTENLIGVVQSINNETSQIQIVSAGGFIEEIKIVPETYLYGFLTNQLSLPSLVSTAILLLLGDTSHLKTRSSGLCSQYGQAVRH